MLRGGGGRRRSAPRGSESLLSSDGPEDQEVGSPESGCLSKVGEEMIFKFHIGATISFFVLFFLPFVVPFLFAYVFLF